MGVRPHRLDRFTSRGKMRNGVELFRREQDGSVMWRAVRDGTLVGELYQHPRLPARGQVDGNWAAAHEVTFTEWRELLAQLPAAG